MPTQRHGLWLPWLLGAAQTTHSFTRLPSILTGEFQRAFRALGLKKRSGAKMDVDQKMFNAFDTNGDGRVSLAELEENLFPATRAKIEEKLDAGWKFDAKRWAASVARHSKIDMSKVFKQFDFDGKCTSAATHVVEEASCAEAHCSRCAA